MIRAYLLYSGADGNSHFKRGIIAEDIFVKAERTLFKESPPDSFTDWHNDPVPQYVVTLSGYLEFETQTGAKFTIHPGDVLLATDETGTGHKWRMLNQEPWKRVYIVFQKNAATNFIANHVQDPD